MAQEVALKSYPDSALARSDAGLELERTVSSFLQGYTQPVTSNAELDILDWRYKINFNAPLPDFNSKNAIAYSATDIKNPDGMQYVALVCETNTVQRIHAISPLINAPHSNLVILLAAGVVELSRFQQERFVVLYEKPKGEKISKLIAATKQRPNFEFICHYIISPIALAIQHMSELGIPHGNINCDNIYFNTETLNVTVGQCVAEPCGFAQPFYYEPVERMQALPSGKGEGTATQDYYALAVVVLHIIYGMNHFVGFTEDALVRGILKEGAYNTLTRNKDMPEVFYDFFRGMISHNSRDRWNYRYLKAWLDGKRYNVMPPPLPQEAIRPFEFANENAYTRREVAHLFFQHWQEVPEIFASGQLSTWVAISLRNKELNEYLLNTVRVSGAPSKRNDISSDEQIMRTITVFDPTGPVRIGRLSFHLDGIGSLFADMMLKQSEPELQLLMQFIELSMFHFVATQKNKEIGKNDELENENISAMFARLDRLRSVIRNTGLGFGVERIFYDLNKNVRCNSSLLAGCHISSLPMLLKALDKLSPKLSQGNDPIDRDIAAFIASYLNIQHEIHLTPLSAHPTLAKHPAMVALKLLAAAQQRTGIAYLPGLTNWLALRILPLLDVIRSRTLKHKLVYMLGNAARSGSLVKMGEVLIESGYSQAEANAYQQAVRNFRQNDNDIKFYTKKEMIEYHSKRLGARMAHYVAIVALLCSFIISVRGG